MTTPTTLKQDLEMLQVNLDGELEGARSQLKAGKAMVAQAKRRLTSAGSKKIEVAKVLETVYPKAPEPRQWNSLDDVPHEVRVRSAKGCGWSFWTKERADRERNFGCRGWMWTSASGDKYDKTAPFTEILKESK